MKFFTSALYLLGAMAAVQATAVPRKIEEPTTSLDKRLGNFIELGGIKVWTSPHPSGTGWRVRIIGGLRVTQFLYEQISGNVARGLDISAAFFADFRNKYAQGTDHDAGTEWTALYKDSGANPTNNGIVGIQWVDEWPFEADGIVATIKSYFADNNHVNVNYEAVSNAWNIGGPYHEINVKRDLLGGRTTCSVHDFSSLFRNNISWDPDSDLYGVSC